jgi:4'-phosphopantetheinyl transferase
MIPTWEIPPPSLSLSKEEIHVWGSRSDMNASSYESLCQILSIDEMMRAQRFHFEKDRKKFIIRRGILRSILGRYLNTNPSLIKFSYGNNGKPSLAHAFEHSRICFNLSHSRGFALYAFARDCEIGVDLQHIHDIPEMEQIVGRYFSLKENDVFRSLPESQKRGAFFKGWTCKEAFVKALGNGLILPLDKFAVSLTPGKPARLLRIIDDSREASRWTIQDLKPAPHYVAAFAVKSHVSEAKCLRI